MEIQAIQGDVTKIEADCLIAPINSSKEKHDSHLDAVIRRSAGGNIYHSQLGSHASLEQGHAIVAENMSLPRKGTFENVVFVVDDNIEPLHAIIQAGLQAANDEYMQSVTIPEVRTGTGFGVVEKNYKRVAAEIAKGIKKFRQRNPEPELKKITVVLNTRAIVRLLNEALAE